MQSVKEITKEQFEYLQNCDRKEFYDFVENEAVHSPFHPAGYGLYNPNILNKEDKYFITWEHLDSCD